MARQTLLWASMCAALLGAGCDLIPPDCVSYEGSVGTLEFAASECLESPEARNACEELFTTSCDDDALSPISYSLTEVSEPNAICSEPGDGCVEDIQTLTQQFQAISPDLQQVLPEWDEGPCFTDEGQNLKSAGGTALFKGFYFEFSGRLPGETIHCCPCWGKLERANNTSCRCNGETALVADICGDIDQSVESLSPRCVFCVSDLEPYRRCGAQVELSTQP